MELPGRIIEPEPPHASTTVEKIEYFSGKYGVSYDDMYKLAWCESGLKEKAFNGKDPYGGAHGIYQYLKPTFATYSKKFGFTEPDIWNVDQQIELTAWMVSLGEAKQWTCSRTQGLFGL